jgi:hypothetical protein
VANKKSLMGLHFLHFYHHLLLFTSSNPNPNWILNCFNSKISVSKFLLFLPCFFASTTTFSRSENKPKQKQLSKRYAIPYDFNKAQPFGWVFVMFAKSEMSPQNQRNEPQNRSHKTSFPEFFQNTPRFFCPAF